MAKKEVTGKQV